MLVAVVLQPRHQDPGQTELQGDHQADPSGCRPEGQPEPSGQRRHERHDAVLVDRGAEIGRGRVGAAVGGEPVRVARRQPQHHDLRRQHRHGTRGDEPNDQRYAQRRQDLAPTERPAPPADHGGLDHHRRGESETPHRVPAAEQREQRHHEADQRQLRRRRRRLVTAQVERVDDETDRHSAEVEIAEEDRPPQARQQQQRDGGRRDDRPPRGSRSFRIDGREGGDQRDHDRDPVGEENCEQVRQPRVSSDGQHQSNRHRGQQADVGAGHRRRDRHDGRPGLPADRLGETARQAPVRELIRVVQGALRTDETHGIGHQRCQHQDREQQRARGNRSTSGPAQPSDPRCPVTARSRARCRRRDWSRRPPARSPPPPR